MNKQIIYIEIDHIVESPLNPRKTFNPAAITELAESIKEVGIIQPLILRPTEVVDDYEIVCGERRYKAAKEADLTEVPAIIRELTDEEAVELMLVENLQRQEVNPMEEGEAYKLLIEKHNYTTASLAAKFGKSEGYIRCRLKLTDLIYIFQKLLREDVINIGHAMEICKLKTDYQKKLFEEKFSDEKRNQSYYSIPTIHDIKSIIKNTYMTNLKMASFDINDTTLGACACTTCPNNTAYNTLLFPDASVDGMCTDIECWRSKTKTSLYANLTRIAQEEPDTIIGYTYDMRDDTRKELEDIGVILTKVTPDNGYTTPYDIPTLPVGEDYEDDREFEEAMADYDDDLDEYKQERATKNFVHVFIVHDSYSYEVKEMIYEPRENTSLESGEKTIDQLILELQAKEAKAADSMLEKVYAAASNILENENFSGIEESMTKTEQDAILSIMASHHWLAKECDFVPFGDEKVDFISNLSPEQRVRVMRSFIKSNLQNRDAKEDTCAAKLLINIVKERYPDMISEVETEQQEKYLKKKASIEKKIEKLKEEVDDNKE